MNADPSSGNEPVEFNDVQDVAEVPKADALVGVTIAGRWKLEEKFHEGKQESGGNFGVGYSALDLQDQIRRFVKVVDFRSRLRNTSQLRQLLSAAEFEVTMQKACIRMSKVVRMVGYGDLAFRTPGSQDPYNYLYLVLERGDGDIKSHVDFRPDRSAYWKLWVLREVALGIEQMERAHLAHNDIKPSNVIRFPSSGTTHNIKLGDVGRAVTKSGKGPFDSLHWAGDPRHMPLEVLYGWQESEWQNRRTSADAYMLGNLACFLFSGSSITERVTNSLPPEYRYDGFSGAYRDLRDIVRHARNNVLEGQVVATFPTEVREELGEIVRWLTEPDPCMRGEPRARRAGTVGIDRIRARLERLAQRTLLHERAMAQAK
ncbi:protein kinase family protein [Achromobacter deleyi]|uniref:protein kinase family protein n=1 Tax=Achromobacter deleyi TaxID=1353891 RepID=UPI001491AB3C|nr:protein kinase family protein [Achromobacter deleyi]QVQ24727.1 protein kinase family protein [Achromobacter deleyi]UIP20264.1 hypothetical protein LYZ39_25350 [Achromobacter deleyi]